MKDRGLNADYLRVSLGEGCGCLDVSLCEVCGSLDVFIREMGG